MKHALLRLTTFALAAASPALAQTFQEPPTAVDLDPDPNVLEVHLTAAETSWEFSPGKPTTVWAYNGSIPGPTIQANLGQTIRVVFTNNLPEPTTIHWHGIEAPAQVDGSHVSQAPIAPGATFTYEWTAINAGMHWYHPHVRTNDQVEKGLYGVIIIRDVLAEHDLGLDGIEEHVVVFDDVLLDSNDQIVPAFSFTDPLQNATYQLNGREGNVLLVNGRVAPVTINVPNGQPQRWRVVNAANSTFCRLGFRDPDEGIQQQPWEIGCDGGFGERPYLLWDITSTAPGPDHPGQALLSQQGEGVFLMPGERLDVAFTPIGTDGQAFSVFQHDWYRGRHTAAWSSTGTIMLGNDPMDGLYPKQKYIEMVVQGPDPGLGEYQLPAKLRDFPAWTVPPKGTLPITMGHGVPDAVTGDVIFFVQAEMVSGMMNPLPMPKMTSLKAHDVEIGDIWLWEVTNLTHGEHPFHTHGFAFELVEYEFQDDVDPSNNFSFQPGYKRRYKDTFRCPPRLGAKGTSRTISRFRVEFSDVGREGQAYAQGEQATFDPDGNWTSGGWLAHCHILEHSARGMMTFFEVHDPSDPYRLLGRFLPSTLGNASLTAEGDLSPGSAVTFHLVNGRPNSVVLLAVGNIAANRSFFGGTFVPGYSSDGTTVAPKPLFAKLYTLSTDGNGELSFSTADWNLAPTGSRLFWQAAFKDPGLPLKWAFSNALSFDR